MRIEFNAVIMTPTDKYGQNLLGKALMSVRDEFKSITNKN